jgi:PAS domain S-box-containing protein
MALKKIPFYNRILFWLLLPVVIVGITCATLLVTYLSSPMKAYLVGQFDANLKLASIMGLRTCEESFNYLLDLRLEKDAEMNQTMKNEALKEIDAIGNQFPHIHLMVLESGRHFKTCSLDDSPEKWEAPLMEPRDDTAIEFHFNGKPVKAHVRFFPFWDWHIISFVFHKDYERPIEMAYRITYLSAMGVFLAVVGALLIVFYLFIKRPLDRLISATDHVAEGRFIKIDRISHNELGRLTVSFNSMIDSLEHEKAEVISLIDQLRESEALFRSQFEFGNIGIAVSTLENLIRANERLCRVLGYSEAELKQKPWPEMTHPEDLEIEMAHYNRMLEGEIESYEMDKRVFHKNGSIVFVHLNVSCFRNPDRSIRFVITSLLDISGQKQIEEDLRQLRNYLTNIIDSMPSVLVGVDHEGRVTQWNKTIEQNTGITAGAAHGNMLSHILPQMASAMKKISRSIQSRQIIHEQKRSDTIHKHAGYEDMTIYPLITNGVEGAVIRIDDVTERVRLEEMMVQSEKMLSVGGLAAGMAHEINNPLAGMMQTADVMAGRLGERLHIPANHRAAEEAGTTLAAIEHFMTARGIPRMLNTINASGSRIAAIVDNMLSFARKSESTFSPHDLGELLEKTLALAATDYDLKKQYDFKRIEIRKEFEENLPAVPCEGVKIQQVLLNIIRNGAEAMQGAETKNPRFIFRTRLDEARNMACLEIEDNGYGMDEKTRKRVFEPFFTTKTVGVGTGLGLSVSYFIITENHRGEMVVESRPGSGAKFIIHLPLKGVSA